MSTDSEKLLIRVKIDDQFRFVEIDKNNIEVQNFIKIGLTTFDIDIKDDLEIEICDQFETPISTDAFRRVVDQFSSSSCFYIKLKISRGKGSVLITKDLQKFLVEQKVQWIFNEFNSTKQLQTKAVSSLCDKLLIFIQGKDPKLSRATIEDACKAAIKIFPCLKWENSEIEGIDVVYDNKSRKGVLYHKITYIKSKERSQRSGQNPDSHKRARVAEIFEELTEEQQTELILFFKTCVVHTDKELLKLKMNETVKFRRSLITKNETRFPELFPFYFVESDLVLYDFEISFETIRSTALLENWPTLKLLIIENIFNEKLDANWMEEYDEDTAYFLVLAKYLCSTKGFDPSQFFIFCNDIYKDPRELRNSKIANPIIVAIGDTKRNISHFYIVVEQELLSVPPDFDFVLMMDLFFKTHKIFNQNYFSQVKKILNFFEYYVYEMKTADVKPNVKMLNLSRKLFQNVTTEQKV